MLTARCRRDEALAPKGQHPHIVRLEEFSLNSDASCAMLTMDFVQPAVCDKNKCTDLYEALACGFFRGAQIEGRIQRVVAQVCSYILPAAQDSQTAQSWIH